MSKLVYCADRTCSHNFQGKCHKRAVALGLTGECLGYEPLVTLSNNNVKNEIDTSEQDTVIKGFCCEEKIGVGNISIEQHSNLMGRVIFIILNLFFIIAILVSFWKDEQVEINKINQAYNDDIKILEENIKVLEEEKKELNEENSILSNKYNELLEKYDNAQKELEEKDKVIEELKSSIDLDSLGIDTGKKTYMDKLSKNYIFII